MNFHKNVGVSVQKSLYLSVYLVNNVVCGQKATALVEGKEVNKRRSMKKLLTLVAIVAVFAAGFIGTNVKVSAANSNVNNTSNNSCGSCGCSCGGNWNVNYNNTNNTNNNSNSNANSNANTNVINIGSGSASGSSSANSNANSNSGSSANSNANANANANTNRITVASTKTVTTLPKAGAEAALLPGAMTTFAFALRKYLAARKEAALLG